MIVSNLSVSCAILLVRDVMRKKQSFLLTLLPSEETAEPIHGKIKTIATGRISSFSNLDELYQLLKDELKGSPLSSQEIDSFFSSQPSNFPEHTP
jgi:hypothetical protein